MPKFRIWDKIEKEWATDFTLTLDGELLCDNGTTLFIRDNFELTQWTEWNDKNNNPIFDGDIIDCGYDDEFGRMKVQWDKDKCMFCFMWIGKPWDWHEFDEFSENDLEIIGNIYETPEYLDPLCVGISMLDPQG